MRCRGTIPEVAVAANPHLMAAFTDPGRPDGLLRITRDRRNILTIMSAAM
ncbi:MAG: hypothetical protein OXU64_03865 [Gemmatimonadota bacterium]|nr:hypothetical protein [Gemmatimonadota bacterium]